MMKIILGGNDVNDRAETGNVSGSVDSDPVGRVVSSPVASATGQDVVSGGVCSVLSPQGSGSGLPVGTSVSLVESEPMSVDVQDNELDELASQPLLASESGVVGDGVLVPSLSDRVLEASASQAGVSQVKGLQSSPSFSPLSGSVLSVTPSSAVSEEVDGSASVVSDSRPLRSRIPVKVPSRGGVSGLLTPPPPPLCHQRRRRSWYSS